MTPVYFDHNATTPLDPGIRAAMLPLLEQEYGNPSSVHQIGRRARSWLDDARDRAAAALGCKPSELVFTGGGTEANNLAVIGAARRLRDRGRHLVTTPVEHHAVLHCFEHLARHEGFQLTLLPVDREGRVDPADVEKALRRDTVLVSVMAANNETGALQPVAEIGRLCRQRGVCFHTDAVQWAGKQPLERVHDLEADVVTFCAHKVHGPKGAGAVFVRSPLLLSPVQLGGAQENEARAGTENLAAIAGVVESIVRFVRPPVFDTEEIRGLVSCLESCLERIEGVECYVQAGHRLPNTVSFSVEGTDSISLLAALDLHGICASSGAACSAGSVTPSHVLLAMGVARERASAFVRLSLGRSNTLAEVERVMGLLPGIVAQTRGERVGSRL